jgi:hypothetical protein
LRYCINRSIVQKLGAERTRRIPFVGKKEVDESAYGQVVLGAGSSMGLDEELALEAAKAGMCSSVGKLLMHVFYSVVYCYW